jgi:hypothetical protein
MEAVGEWGERGRGGGGWCLLYGGRAGGGVGGRTVAARAGRQGSANCSLYREGRSKGSITRVQPVCAKQFC